MLTQYVDYKGNNFAGSAPLSAWLADGANRNFIADYSVTPVTASYAPSGLTVTSVCALQIMLAWTGAVAPIDWEKYGNLATALPVGLDIKSTRSGVVNRLLPPNDFILSNGDLIDQRLFITGSGGTTNVVLLATIPFCVPLQLNGTAGDTIEITLNDDFTGLASQRFMILGATGYLTS
jgi:hypothetical protein